MKNTKLKEDIYLPNLVNLAQKIMTENPSREQRNELINQYCASEEGKQNNIPFDWAKNELYKIIKGKLGQEQAKALTEKNLFNNILGKKLNESEDELTDDQKDMIKEMVQMDFECGHPENDYDELVGLLSEDPQFVGSEDVAAKYYMELLSYGPAGFYEEFKDELEFDSDFAAEYGGDPDYDSDYDEDEYDEDEYDEDDMDMPADEYLKSRMGAEDQEIEGFFEDFSYSEDFDRHSSNFDPEELENAFYAYKANDKDEELEESTKSKKLNKLKEKCYSKQEFDMDQNEMNINGVKDFIDKCESHGRQALLTVISSDGSAYHTTFTPSSWESFVAAKQGRDEFSRNSGFKGCSIRKVNAYEVDQYGAEGEDFKPMWDYSSMKESEIFDKILGKKLKENLSDDDTVYVCLNDVFRTEYCPTTPEGFPTDYDDTWAAGDEIAAQFDKYGQDIWADVICYPEDGPDCDDFIPSGIKEMKVSELRQMLDNESIDTNFLDVGMSYKKNGNDEDGYTYEITDKIEDINSIWETNEYEPPVEDKLQEGLFGKKNNQNSLQNLLAQAQKLQQQANAEQDMQKKLQLTQQVLNLNAQILQARQNMGGY